MIVINNFVYIVIVLLSVMLYAYILALVNETWLNGIRLITIVPECCSTKCHSAKCCSSDCNSTEHGSAECHSTKCRLLNVTVLSVVLQNVVVYLVALLTLDDFPVNTITQKTTFRLSARKKKCFCLFLPSSLTTCQASLSLLFFMNKVDVLIVGLMI